MRKNHFTIKKVNLCSDSLRIVPLVSSKNFNGNNNEKRLDSFQLKKKQTKQSNTYLKSACNPCDSSLFLHIPHMLRSVTNKLCPQFCERKVVWWRMAAVLLSTLLPSPTLWVGVWAMWGWWQRQASGHTVFIWETKCISCISWGFFQLWSCAGGWRLGNDEGIWYSELLHHFSSVVFRTTAMWMV